MTLGIDMLNCGMNVVLGDYNCYHLYWVWKSADGVQLPLSTSQAINGPSYKIEFRALKVYQRVLETCEEPISYPPPFLELDRLTSVDNSCLAYSYSRFANLAQTF